MQPRDWKTTTAVFSAAVKGTGGMVVFIATVSDVSAVTEVSSLDVVDADSCPVENDITGCIVSSLEIEVGSSSNVVEAVVSCIGKSFVNIIACLIVVDSALM